MQTCVLDRRQWRGVARTRALGAWLTQLDAAGIVQHDHRHNHHHSEAFFSIDPVVLSAGQDRTPTSVASHYGQYQNGRLLLSLTLT